jgi:hypothetical protein
MAGTVYVTDTSGLGVSRQRLLLPTQGLLPSLVPCMDLPFSPSGFGAPGLGGSHPHSRIDDISRPVAMEFFLFFRKGLGAVTKAIEIKSRDN